MVAPVAPLSLLQRAIWISVPPWKMSLCRHIQVFLTFPTSRWNPGFPHAHHVQATACMSQPNAVQNWYKMSLAGAAHCALPVTYFTVSFRRSSFDSSRLTDLLALVVS